MGCLLVLNLLKKLKMHCFLVRMYISMFYVFTYDIYENFCRRVVPFADEQVGNEARPFVLVNGRILTRPAAGGFLKQQQQQQPPEQPARQQPASRGGASKRRKREKTPPTLTHRKRASPGGNGGQFASVTIPAGTTAAAAAAPSGSISHIATSERSGGTGAGTGSGTPRGAPSSSPRTRKEHHGRWSTDRYEAAQRSLIHILRLMGATSPDVSVLRPTLREEARKVIGDTGLLDHLLKHLADQVVSAEGERLRRRHNREGHMEYWLQNPAAMEEEEKMMQNELTALTSELREVREARHALQTVRTEAAQAIQAVSGLKEHPTEAAAGLVVGMQTPGELAIRMDAVELANVDLQRRLYDAESLAASSIEELRKELSQAGHVLGEHIGNFQAATEQLTQRCRELEFKSAVAAENASGRFEAVSAALTQAVGVTNVFRQEMAQRDVILGYLQREMAGLRQALATVTMVGAPTAVALPQQAEQQQQQMSPVVTTTTTSQTSRPSQPDQVAVAAPHPSLQLQHMQQQPFSAVPVLLTSPPATTKFTPPGVASTALDKTGTAAAGAAVPGRNYQPLTPLSAGSPLSAGAAVGAGAPSSAAAAAAAAAALGSGGDAATAPIAVPTNPPEQSTDKVPNLEIPLQMSRQALEPTTMSLAAQEDDTSPRLASTIVKKDSPPPPTSSK
jgi:hypothetical protein